MPLYEYQCPGCGLKFEVMQRYSGKALTRCPDCKTVARRLVSVVNHSFRLTERSHERPRDEFERDV